MLLFDDYRSMFNFLMENLSEKLKYEYLYSTYYTDSSAPSHLAHEKYGRPQPPYSIYHDLWKHGYAYTIESKESKDITFEGVKYIILR
jgi:hypothetical protein